MEEKLKDVQCLNCKRPEQLDENDIDSQGEEWIEEGTGLYRCPHCEALYQSYG
jgi:Zn finger protein HypA/HybF involved in hydrogenase expression